MARVASHLPSTALLNHYLVPFPLPLCAGMLYLHTRSPPIAHRDLKSANLLVTSQWNVKVGQMCRPPPVAAGHGQISISPHHSPPFYPTPLAGVRFQPVSCTRHEQPAGDHALHHQPTVRVGLGLYLLKLSGAIVHRVADPRVLSHMLQHVLHASQGWLGTPSHRPLHPKPTFLPPAGGWHPRCCLATRGSCPLT